MRDAAIDTHRSAARGADRSRSAGAPRLDDLVGEGPVSRTAPGRGGITSAAIAAQRLGGGRSSRGPARGPGRSGALTRLRGRLPRIRPLKALTIAAFGVALVGIVANAMVFQRSSHVPPVFGLGRSADAMPDAAARTAAAVPAPAAPAPIEKTGTIASVIAAPEAAPPVAPTGATPRPAPIHHAAPKVHHDETAAKPDATVAKAAHPRPGHPAGAKVVSKSDAKVDPVARLLAGTAHPAPAIAKAPAKPAATTGATPPAKTAAAAPAPHHRLAQKTSGESAKPAGKTE